MADDTKGWTLVAETPQTSTPMADGVTGPPALALSGTAAAIPIAARMASAAVANPTALPRTLSTIGQLSGAAAEFYKGNPLMAGPAAWAGGKGGWFTGKLLQRAAPAAEAVLNSPAVHIAQNVLSGAGALQGGLELSAMGDNPKRQDIGFLGMSANGGPIDSAHPPMMNEAIAKIAERMGRPDIADLWRGKKGQ